MKDKAKVQHILDDVHALLFTAERSNPAGEITHLDFQRILVRVREHFPEGVPPEVDLAIRKAERLSTPFGLFVDTLKKRVLGGTLAFTGLVLTSGSVMRMFAQGGPIYTPTAPPQSYLGAGLDILISIFKDPQATSPITDYFGMIMIVVGITLLVTGIYFLRLKTSQKVNVLKGAEVLKNRLFEPEIAKKVNSLPSPSAGQEA